MPIKGVSILGLQEAVGKWSYPDARVSPFLVSILGLQEAVGKSRWCRQYGTLYARFNPWFAGSGG